MNFDVYLRQGRETVHSFRFRGSRDLEEANRVFQAMIEEPAYSRSLGRWNSVAFFPVGSDRGRTFPRIEREIVKRWF